jgi:hypothetical protein
MSQDLVKNGLNTFGKVVVKESRTALTKKGKNDTKGLYNSIKYTLKVSKNSFQLEFLMDDYGKFVDKGVKGKNSNLKAPNSPFRFGKSSGSGRKKGGLSDSIDIYVKRKRIQFRDRKSGKFMSFKQTAYLISGSIYNKGIKTTNFFTKPFDAAFNRLPNEIVESYGLEVDKLLEQALK